MLQKLDKISFSIEIFIFIFQIGILRIQFSKYFIFFLFLKEKGTINLQFGDIKICHGINIINIVSWASWKIFIFDYLFKFQLIEVIRSFMTSIIFISSHLKKSHSIWFWKLSKPKLNFPLNTLVICVFLLRETRKLKRLINTFYLKIKIFS